MYNSTILKVLMYFILHRLQNSSIYYDSMNAVYCFFNNEKQEYEYTRILEPKNRPAFEKMVEYLTKKSKEGTGEKTQVATENIEESEKVQEQNKSLTNEPESLPDNSKSVSKSPDAYKNPSKECSPDPEPEYKFDGPTSTKSGRSRSIRAMMRDNVKVSSVQTKSKTAEASKAKRMELAKSIELSKTTIAEPVLFRNSDSAKKSNPEYSKIISSEPSPTKIADCPTNSDITKTVDINNAKEKQVNLLLKKKRFD